MILDEYPNLRAVKITTQKGARLVVIMADGLLGTRTLFTASCTSDDSHEERYRLALALAQGFNTNRKDGLA